MFFFLFFLRLLFFETNQIDLRTETTVTFTSTACMYQRNVRHHDHTAHGSKCSNHQQVGGDADGRLQCAGKHPKWTECSFHLPACCGTTARLPFQHTWPPEVVKMERCRPSIGKMQSYIPFRSGGCRERKRKGKGKGKRKGVWVGRANEDNLEGK